MDSGDDVAKKRENTPELVVEAAFKAFQARDGYVLANLATPPSLQAYVDQVRSELDSESRATISAELLRRHDPEMPAEVAEWQADRFKRDHATHTERLLAEFDGVSSIDELRSLEAPELLTRALRAAPDLAVTLDCRVIGHVLDGAAVAFVLFWLTDAGVALFDEPRVAAVDRVNGRWMLRLATYPRWGMPGFQNLTFVSEIDL